MIMYSLMALTAMVVSYFATWLARSLGNRYELFTPIRLRDQHTKPVPRLGGLGIFAGVLVALLVASQSFFVKDIFKGNASPWGVLAGAAVIVLVGLLDDLIDLKWWIKLLGQFGAGLVVAVWGVRMTVIPFFGEPIHLTSYPLSVAVTAFLIAVTMNALNFIDGLDGLAAGVSIIGGSAFFLMAYWVHRNAVLLDYSDLATLLTAVIVGSCLGFLPHNWYPARIFMGDSGAMLIGLLMASAGIVATGQVGSGLYERVNGLPTVLPLLLPFMVMAVPLLDLISAVVRRTARGRSPWAADRGHLHHKLLDLGHSDRSAVLLMYAWTAVLAYGCAAMAFFPWGTVVTVVLILCAILTAMTLKPRLARSADDS
ncbi:MraY family glycosyltransferase [Arthrobacter sp. Y-9]|uniref:MraY family glycosyltransferase n=1 Tax=Arthrobacter sp. Y-9 TaxID=3039385 RepID=UPI001B2BD137|nr:MraY family glycosyltransferase [Arthrobacter sp. Y-9]MBO9704609.1 undecaprenyl/decaprenyl-phosphate alpha-N-acetylglucosaminyl 1-phosphate transferase [Arthrobacter sp.]WFR83023.1 MraY family glycosyltransferase [Arthrobacter sp. Y-9]